MDDEQPASPACLPRKKKKRLNLMPRIRGILYSSTSVKSGRRPSIASAVFNASWTGQCIGYPVNQGPEEPGYVAIQDIDVSENPPPPPPPKSKMEDLYATLQKNRFRETEARTSQDDDDDMESEQELAVYEQPKDETAWVNRQKQATQSVRRKSNRRLGRYIKTLKIENGKLNSKVCDLQKHIEQLNLKMNQIQASVAKPESPRNAGESTQALSDEINSLKKRMESLSQQNDSLIRQLAETKMMWNGQKAAKETSLRAEREKEIDLWKQKYSDLKIKYEQLLEYYKEWIPPREHVAFVQETQSRLLDELKQKYQEETDKLQSRIKDIESERRFILDEGNRLKMKINHLIADKNNIDGAYTQLLQKCQKLMSQMHESNNHEKELQALIQDLLCLAERVTKERDYTIKKTQVQQKNFTAQLIEKSLNVGRLQERLKEFREKTENKTITAEARLQERESNWKQLQNEYQREMHNLRVSLLEKEQAFNDLHEKKSQLEQDLDILFKSVKNDNKNIQKKLQKV